MLTQMEYIKSIAPDGYMEAFNEDTLKELFKDEWEEYRNSIVNECYSHSEEELVPNTINEKLDYMVLTLVREFGDKLAFKGGYVLTKLIPDVARQSTDIDFSIDYDSIYYDMIDTFKRIGNHFIEEGYVSRYTIKESIEPHKSGGVDFYDSSGAKVIGIYVGWRPTNFGTMHTDVGIATLRHFTVERMLSDKFVAILTNRRFRRSKDLYDLYQLMRYYDIDMDELRNCIRVLDTDTPVQWDNYPFNETVLREYRKAYDALRVLSVYKEQSVKKPLFDDAIECFGYLYYAVRSLKLKRYDHTSRTFM